MRSRKLRVGAIAVAAIAIAALGSVAPALAKTHKYKSEVTINLDQANSHGQILTFFGSVVSPKSKCAANREVSILLQDPRSGIVSARGRTTTNGSGAWRIEGVHGNAGEFFAVVEKFTYKKKHVCKSGQDSLQFP